MDNDEYKLFFYFFIFRYEGKIVNRMLTRRNCIMLINDIWKAKVLYDLSLKKKDTTKKVEKVYILILLNRNVKKNQ